MKKLLSLAFAALMLIGCSKNYVKVGINQSLVGPNTESAVHVEWGGYDNLVKKGNHHIEYGGDIELHLHDTNEEKKSETNDADMGAGLGINLRYLYEKSNWDFYIGGGFVAASGYGNHPNLATSTIYGKTIMGVQYKSIFIEYLHESSPFHGGSDGDIGLNFIMLGVEF